MKKNLLLLRLLVMITAMLAIQHSKAQSISYRNIFDLSSGATFEDNFVLGGTSIDVAFSDDGSKMFVVNFRNVIQYSLTTPYRPDLGATQDVFFSVSTEDTSPQGITFSNDGMKMFIMGFSSKSIIEYSLTNAYDLTSGASASGNTYSVVNEQSNPRTVKFNDTGDKMYVIGINSPNDIDQYSLSAPFDITSTVTYEGALVLASSSNTGVDMAFSNDGTKLFVLTNLTDRIEQYTLTTPFDLTGTVTMDEASFDATAHEPTPSGITFNDVGDRLYIIGSNQDDVFQYQLNPGSIQEASVNNGTVEGSAVIQITGETFTKAGGTLTSPDDYTITGIPAGLSPTLAVAADGSSVTFSLTGTAAAHQDVNDVASLTFDFTNKAFTGSNAAAVTGASSASSGISINFLENNPIMSYGSAFQVVSDDTSLDGTVVITPDAATNSGLTFSNDGSRVYVVDQANNQVFQYLLDVPFEINSGFSLEGSPLDISADAGITPRGIVFSPDGTKMFIVEQGSRQIEQYTLTTPWDLNGTVTNTGSPLSVISEESAPTGMTFNTDGTKMFIVGFSGREVNQYSLMTPYDLSSGVTFDGTPFPLTGLSSPRDIAFDTKGLRMFVLDGSTARYIYEYDLNSPFDITNEPTYNNNTFRFPAITPESMAFSPQGNRLWVIGFSNDNIYQYNLEEKELLIEVVGASGSNGTVAGSFAVCLADDQFINEGGRLTFGSDYTISNLPAGLSPLLEVAAGGQLATFSLSSNATNHQDADDVADLIFTFNNSAFVSGNASAVTNGTAANSGVGIDFTNDDPAITYGSIFDLSSGLSRVASEDVSDDDIRPMDLTFSADGLKLYVIGDGSDEIDQYELVSAFDLRLGKTYEGSFSVPDSRPTSLAFSTDGSKLFVLGDNSNRVTQFTVTTPFDVTGTVTQDGFYSVGGVINAMHFSPDGSQLWVGPTFIDGWARLDLTTPFDITGTVTSNGLTDDFGAFKDFAISNDGKNLVVLHADNQARTYYLTTAFDVTSFVENPSAFNMGIRDSNMTGIYFTPNGDQLFTVGNNAQIVDQFALNAPVLVENNANNGAIDSPSQGFLLTAKTFNNAGGTLNNGTHFNISNLPTGLMPSLQVASSGKSATLILNGNATNNANADDIDGLIFDFMDAAFAGGNASGVTNASSTNSGIQLDFRDGTPSLTYESGSVTDFEESFDDNGSLLGSFTLSLVDDSFTNPGGTLVSGTDFTITNLPAGLTPVLAVAQDGFSAELTITGNATNSDIANDVADLIFNFTNSAFGNGNASAVANATMSASGYGIRFKELTATISSGTEFALNELNLVGSPFDLSGETTSPQGMAFSADGTRLFVVANSESEIIQYGLTTPFKITGGVTLEGTPYDLSANETSPSDVTFNNDGTKMYVSGFSRDDIQQFTLTTPFDINGMVTHDGSFDLGSSTANPRALAFSSDGSRLFVRRSSSLNQYALTVPFDVTSTVTLINSIGNSVFDFAFTPDGKQFFTTSTNRVNRSDLTAGAFDIVDGFENAVLTTVSGATTLALSPDGTTILVANGSTDEILQYEFPGLGVSEVSANNGTVDGTYFFKLVGDAFTNAGNNLTFGSDFTISGTIPAGLTPQMTISADASEATLSFTGNATNHEDANDLDNPLTIAFLNSAFTSNNASVISNSTFGLSGNFDFNDNAALTYTPTSFYETLDNQGQVTSSMRIDLVNDTFSKTGLLTPGVEYSIADVPAGLMPNLVVASNRLFALLTFNGTATNHENINDVADLVISFTDEAFTLTEASFVNNAVNASSGSKIDFDDRNAVVRYGEPFDVSDNPVVNLAAELNIDAQEDAGGGFAFSNDGLKLFVVGFTNDEVFQFNLSTPFDVSSGVTYSGHSYDVSSMVTSPADLAFDASGTKMFVLNSGADELEQYQLATAFDLSSTITHMGTFDVGSQDIQPAAIAFSRTGRKMYLLGAFNNKIFQYNLGNSYDVTSGVTYEGESILLATRNYSGISLSENGTQVFVSNTPFPGQAEIRQYTLNTSFDITAGLSNQGSLTFPNEQSPGDFIVSPDLTKLFVLSGEVLQFDLPNDGFLEGTLNNGDVNGSLNIQVFQETFTNAGGSLSHGTDYSVNNLPTGLTPTLDVAGDGLSASLSLTGMSNDHQDIHDISNLNITFNNSAFTGNDASQIANSDNAATNRSIDFRDNSPVLFHGDSYVATDATLEGTPFEVSTDAPSAISLRFSSDGSRMFVLSEDDGVSQFSLTTPFETSSGVTFDGSPFNVFSEDSSPEGMSMSTDGNKLFILGRDNDAVFQYSLNAAFDVTAGGTLDGSFSIATQSSGSRDLDFSSDGLKMFILDATGENRILQYNLAMPFQVTSGVTFSNRVSIEENNPLSVRGFAFSPDGYYLSVISSDGPRVNQYRLNTAFDVSEGLLLIDPLLLPNGNSFQDLAFSADGSKVFLLNTSNEEVEEHVINTGGFVERAANDGVVEGDATIYLIDDTFVSAGGTLAQGTHYSITGLPMGLTPTLTVAVDGYSAVLTLSGSVSAHGNDDDISGLSFTFNNMAFTNSMVSDVANANNFLSNIGIDFLPYTGNDITDFTLTEETDAATIDPMNHEITIDVAAGTDRSALVPSISVSVEASINPTSGTAQDLSAPFTYTVTAEDGTPQDWEVTVNEEQAAPTDISLSTSTYAENLATGTTIATLSSTDLNFQESFMYALVTGDGDDDNAVFAITSDELKINTSADFEMKSNFTIRVETTDADGLTFSKAFALTVIDVNDNPTSLSLSANTIAELEPAGTAIGAFSTVDQDTGDSHTYTLTANAMANEFDNADFEIVGNELRNKTVFDFETQSNYTIHVRSTDSGGAFVEDELTINVTDVLPMVTSLDLDNLTIDENESTGTLVGTFTSSGVELSGSFTYTLVVGAGDTDNMSFSISGDQLLSAGTFDFETKDSFSVRVQTDDGTGGVLAETFTITVNDLNEAPSDLNLSGSAVNESNPIGTAIGTLSSTDADAGDTHQYSLVAGTGDTDNAQFQISGDELQTNAIFDFESQASYSIRIQTEDTGGLTHQESFTISINDLPAQVTSIELDHDQVNENEAIATLVGNLSTFGEDLSGTFTYTLVSGLGDTDNSSFSISGDLLQTATAFNFESQSSYTIRIQTDDGIGNTLEETLTISILDVSEAPTDISLSNSSIIENNTIGDVIGDLTTTDEDAGETYTYALVAGTGDDDNASFTLSGTELQAADVFDFESQASYAVRIETQDGNGGSYEKSFTISISDENESILIINPIDDEVQNEDFASLDIDFSNVFEDQDGDALTYEVSSSDESIVTVSHVGTTLTVTEVGGFGSSTITITADDGSGVTNSDEFSFTVIDVNEAPVVITATEDQSAVEGFGTAQISFANTFQDGDGDAFTLSVTSSDIDVVTATVSGNDVEITEVGIGTSTVTVTADDGRGGTVDDVLTFEVTEAPSTDTDILTLTLTEATGNATIDATGHTVTIEVMNGTDLTNLTPTITLSEGATINPTSGTPQDFSTSVSYTVTAEDGATTQDWTITVTEAPNTETDILTFVLAEQTGDANIDATAHTVSIEVSNGTDLTSLTPTVTLSDGASINPASGTAQDFSTSASYTVTAEDGSTTQEWTIIVTEAPNTETDILTFVLAEQTGDAIIDATSHTVSIKVSNGTDLTSLTPTVTLSDGASINPASGTAQDFSTTVTYTVTAEDGTSSQDWVVTATEAANPLSDETDILTFELSEQTGAANIDVNAHTVSIEVSNGTDPTSLTPTITLSDGASINPASGTVQDFSTTVTYTVTAEDGTTSQDWVVTVTEAANPLSDETDILTFELSEQTGAANIDATAHTVSIEVSNGTDLTSLTPTITLSDGASINPASGIVQDFSTTVTYTVTAEDETTSQDWVVTVTEAAEPLSTETDILTFVLSEQTGTATVDATAHTVSIEVSNGTDLTSLTPTITLSDGASINPTSGTAQDFSAEVTYTVTAEDGTTTQDWVVTVTEAANPLSDETDILTFVLSEQTGDANIDATAHTVSIEVGNGTDLTSLTPTITLSDGASINPASGTAQDFSTTVTYTVTAEDGTTSQDWVVIVTEAANPLSDETDILTFELSEQTGVATIDATAHTVSIEVNNGTDLTSLNPAITLSDGASINPVSGTTQDFSAEVTYTVTAEDGTTSQDWVVIVTEAAVLSTSTEMATKVYPNPTQQWLSIDDAPLNAQVSLYNKTGQLVRNVRYQNGLRLDLRDLPAGIYHLRIYDPSTAKIHNNKIMKR